MARLPGDVARRPSTCGRSPGSGEPIELRRRAWEPVARRGRADGARSFRSASSAASSTRRRRLGRSSTLDPSDCRRHGRCGRRPGTRCSTADDVAGRRLAAVSRSSTCPTRCLPPYCVVRWDGTTATVAGDVDGQRRGPRRRSRRRPSCRDLPVDVLLAALASTRPLPVALEHELRRRERTTEDDDGIELDPAAPLRRQRAAAAAGPPSLARAVATAGAPQPPGDEPRRAPLAPLRCVRPARHRRRTRRAPRRCSRRFPARRTSCSPSWRSPSPPSTGRASPAASIRTQVRALVAEVLDAIDERRPDLPPAPTPALDAYVRDALEAARR